MLRAGPLMGLALLAILFAGCAGGAPAAAPTAPTTSDPDAGDLAGVVVTDERMPIAKAKITALSQATGENRTATSGEDGRFLIAGLPPGAYVVAAEALFYETTTQAVEIRPGETTRTTFLLQGVVKEVAFVDVHPKKGFINCSIHSLGPYGPFNACERFMEDKAKFPVPFLEGGKVRGVVAEVVWKPTTVATGTDLELALCNQMDPVQNPLNCRATSGTAFRRDIRGKSPLVLGVMDLPLQTYKTFDVSVGDGGQTAPRVPLTFQQSFDLWLSMCYVEPCSPAYSARPPA